MSTLSWRVTRRLARAEAGLDRLRWRTRARLGLTGPFTIVPYRGHGDGRALRLRARVLEDRDIPHPHPGDGAWKNMWRMMRRYRSAEVPDSVVRARIGSRTVTTRADAEGFVDLEVPRAPGERAGGWQRIELELCAPVCAGQPVVRATAQVFTPPAAARLAVVSDIDDTIVHTGATTMLRQLRTVLFENAATRAMFPGLAAFYRALARGAARRPVNPIFYVSSSPWNLYELFDEFLARHDIPRGPMFLKDYGLGEGKWLTGNHRDHKSGVIQELLHCYPHLDFVLIGDSGQKDADIYRDLALSYPGRIAAIYVRDVTEPDGDRRAHTLLDEIGTLGVDVAFGEDLLRAAEHAAARGWIASDAVREVRSEIAAA